MTTIRRAFARAAQRCEIAVLCIASILGGCDEGCPSRAGAGLGALSSWERVYIDIGGTPPSPSASFIEGEERVMLAFRDWTPDAWDGRGDVALVVHGSSAHSGLYSAWGEGLAGAGVYARLIDMRGHGLSLCAETSCDEGMPAARTYIDDNTYTPGRLGDALDPEQLSRDLAQHIVEVRRRWPEARVHLIGHSSGGGAVARFIEGGGAHQLATATLVAPFLHPDQRHAVADNGDALRCPNDDAYAQLDAGALGAALRGDVHRYVLRFNKAADYRDPLDTLQNTYTAMTGMQVRNLDTYRTAFQLPTLWVAGEHDNLFDVEASRRESEGFPVGAGFVVVRDTSHVGLTWSAPVATAIARWIVDPTAPRLSEIDGAPEIP